MERAAKQLAVVGLCLAVGGCLPVLETSLSELREGQPGFDTTVQVRFLGGGGFMVRLGSEAFMTAPLYSNPSLVEIEGEAEIPPHTERIRKFHHPTARPGDIKAILVGHAHYDHLMDVAPVWNELSHKPPIYGSLTMRNVLAGYDAEDGPVKNGAVVALDDPDGKVGDAVDYQSCQKPQPCEGCSPAEECPHREQGPGRWVEVPDSRIRLLALCGAHPPQFAGIHKWPGCLKVPRTAPPLFPRDYPEGRVLAYLIDFLDKPGGKPVFRVYYQDAPADSKNGWGMIPASWLADRNVDLALLCGGTWDEFDEAEAVAKIGKAAHIVLGHWEDFFVSQSVPVHPIPTLRGKEYLRRLRKATGVTAIVPAPNVMMRFPL